MILRSEKEQVSSQLAFASERDEYEAAQGNKSNGDSTCKGSQLLRAGQRRSRLLAAELGQQRNELSADLADPIESEAEEVVEQISSKVEFGIQLSPFANSHLPHQRNSSSFCDSAHEEKCTESPNNCSCHHHNHHHHHHQNSNNNHHNHQLNIIRAAELSGKNKKKKKKQREERVENWSKICFLKFKKQKRPIYVKWFRAKVLFILPLLLVFFDAQSYFYCDKSIRVSAAPLDTDQLATTEAADKPHGFTESKMATTISTTRPSQKFVKQPKTEYTLYVGNSIEIPCVIANRQGPVSWHKGGGVVFDQDLRRASGVPDRFKLIGDPTKGEFNLEINDVLPRDAGEYFCQADPPPENQLAMLLVGTNVTVLDATKTSTTRQPSLETDLSNSLLASGGSKLAASQLQTRDTSSGASTRLLHQPQSQLLSPSPTGGDPSPSAFITPYASTAHQSSSLVQGIQLNLLMTWPYILMIIAVVLMLANVHLIYSLVKRHRRQAGAQALSNSSQLNGSIESGSSNLGKTGGGNPNANGGGGGGGGGSSVSSSSSSAVTASSRLCTVNELSMGELEPSPIGVSTFTLPPPDQLGIHTNQFQQLHHHQQQQQHHHSLQHSPLTYLPQTLLSPQQQLHQHHLQQQLQQQQQAYQQNSRICMTAQPSVWKGQQEFVAIDPDGWVLEI